MITVTKPNHLQSLKRCQKIPQVGLSKGGGDLALQQITTDYRFNQLPSSLLAGHA